MLFSYFLDESNSYCFSFLDERNTWKDIHPNVVSKKKQFDILRSLVVVRYSRVATGGGGQRTTSYDKKLRDISIHNVPPDFVCHWVTFHRNKSLATAAWKWMGWCNYDQCRACSGNLWLSGWNYIKPWNHVQLTLQACTYLWPTLKSVESKNSQWYIQFKSGIIYIAPLYN